MRYLQILLLLLSTHNSFSQKLTLEGGIYCEVPDCNDSTLHKYSIDNISYALNKEFIYDYYYIDSLNRKFKIIRDKNYSLENPLNLIHIDSIQSNYIEKIKIIVSDPVEMFSSFDSSYTQTVFSYDYLNNRSIEKDTLCRLYKTSNRYYNLPCGDEYTGVIDNKMNLWIHPPRQYTFRILQLCPYPFYYLDENVNHWAWDLTTNGFYLDSRWIKSTESIIIHFDYKRMPDEKLKTSFGILQCKVSCATGTIKNKNTTSYTYLKSYYHPNYGFVKLEYDLINKDKIIINLIEMTKI